MSDEKIRNENDYILDYLRLVPQDPSKTPVTASQNPANSTAQGYFDFTSHFVEFSFEESLFEFGLHGSMFVMDAVDYPTLLPMIGEERVQASFTRPDESKKDGGKLPSLKFDLAVYKLAGKRQEGGSRKSQTYTLYYGSDEVFTNMNVRIFKTYKNMPYSKMVESICKDYLKTKKKVFVEETKYNQTYHIQNLSPLKAITKISERCVSNPKDGSLPGYYYVFYEDRDQINFVSLAYLAKQEPVVTYKYKTKNTAEDTEGLSHKPRDVKQDLYNVDNIQNQTGFDTIKAALSGETTASLFSVDPIRRSYSLKAFDLRGETSKKLHNMDLLPNSSWDSFHHMEKGKPWKENGKTFVNPKANMAMLISDNGQDTHEYISSRDKTITPYAPEEFFLQRKSNRQQILKNVITTTVSGDPRIKVGCVIKFEVPELMGKIGKHAPEQQDKYMQGKYLVVGIAHILKKNEYRMNLELVKDSFYSDIKARNPVEEYDKIY